MSVTGFSRTGLARQNARQSWLVHHEPLQDGEDVGDLFKGEDALGAGAQLAGSLGAAQQQDAEDGGLGAGEVERFLDGVFVFWYAGGVAGLPGESSAGKRVQRSAHSVFVERHDRLAVVFLVAGVDECVEREGIVFRRGGFFFHERAEDAGGSRSERRECHWPIVSDCAGCRGALAVQDADERFKAVWIELVWDVLAHDVEDAGGVEGFAVRTFFRERAVDVGDGEDAGVERKLGGDEAVGVSAAVEFFMVLSGDASDVLEAVDAAEDLFGETGMTFDDGELLGGEFAGLVEDGVGDAELAEIVEQSGAVDALDARGSEAEFACDGDGGVGDADGVSEGEGGFGIDDLGEGLADGVDAGVGERAFGGRFAILDGLVEGVDGGDAGKVAGAMKQVGDAHQFRIEPSTAACVHLADGLIESHAGTGLRGEDVEMLSESEDARGDGNGFAAESLGIAAAVPVLVEEVDGVGGGGGETDASGDGGSAVTAQLDHGAVVGVLVKGETKDARDALCGGSAGQGAMPESGDGGEGGPRPVEEFDVALHEAVVAADEQAHARGVAAAADVFQQRGVVEMGLLGGSERQLVGDAQGVEADALGVAGDGAFGEVKGVRERGEKLAAGNAGTWQR